MTIPYSKEYLSAKLDLLECWNDETKETYFKKEIEDLKKTTR